MRGAHPRALNGGFMVRLHMCGWRFLTAAIILSMLLGATVPASATAPSAAPPARPMKLSYVMTLRDGSTARVFSNGVVIATKVDAKTGRMTQQTRTFPERPDDHSPLGAQLAFPSRAQIQRAFERPAIAQAYAPGRLVVVLREGISAQQDLLSLDGPHIKGVRTKTLAATPQYTNDARLNGDLASLGAWRMERLFRTFSRSTVQSLRVSAPRAAGSGGLDISNAYRLELANSTVENAIAKLRANPSVAYVSPDWNVEPMNAGTLPLDRSNPNFVTKRLSESALHRTTAGNLQQPILPTNYATTASQQSMLNATGVNAVSAYDEIERTLHQLPGNGVRITNVSIGDITDASDETGGCARFADPQQGNGPTTILQGGQRYLDLPTMPLIPVYTADAAGNLGQGSVCGTGDGLDNEIDLDFSVMAPLPDNLQRAGRSISGFGDLLGVAPGASYSLIVPGAQSATLTDIDAALMAAAQQQPRPDIITASLGIGVDSIGFPGRYLGDDPLTSAVMAAIATQYNIVLCISANDGTRQGGGLDNVAIGPSGGAAPTDRAAPGGDFTTIGDIAMSSFPSKDFDDGNIVAGATTLDDIFSAQPQNPNEAALASEQSFPETRWNGFTEFATGFGSLVSLAAPGDNIVAFEHRVNSTAPTGGNPWDVGLVLEGGTSASAPEIAAGAAVALQVARAAGRPFKSTAQLRSFLISTGTLVPLVPQSDVINNVGPQLNVGNAVEALLFENGRAMHPSVSRVAIAQRRDLGLLDAAFATDTDPTNIDLQGPISGTSSQPLGTNQFAPITIAPDWEAIPRNARYKLFVTGQPTRVLATTPSARLTPTQLLAAAGLPLVGSNTRTINLTYEARQGMHALAQAAFSLTFGPASGTALGAPAPIVAPVTAGNTMTVAYDISHTQSVLNPLLVVSEPGRVNPLTGVQFHPSYTVPLASLKGTVHIPVSALQGAGIYGVGIVFNNPNPVDIFQGIFTDFAYTRVDDGSNAKPRTLLTAPANSTEFGHYAEQPFNTPFQFSWDASNVPGANGAIIEVSSSGPNNWGIENSFNNQNGSERDQNGVDTGSLSYIHLFGTKGIQTFTPAQLDLVPSAFEQVRVLATDGGRVVGEASDVITVREDGVVPSDGGFIPGANFGISFNGNIGYFADNANLLGSDGNLVASSVQTFDLHSQAIVNTIASNVARSFYTLSTGVLYPNDIGIYDQYMCNPSIPVTPSSTFCAAELYPNNYIVNPITQPGTNAIWNYPAAFGGFSAYGALNRVSDEALIAGVQEVNGPPDWLLVLSNLKNNTIDQTYDVNGPLGPPGAVQVSALTENTTTNQAVLGYVNFANPNSGNCFGLCPSLAAVNLQNGAVQTIPNVPGKGFPCATAVDTANNKAIVVPEFSNVATIYNLTTMAPIVSVTLGTSFYPGFTPDDSLVAAADPVHHLFIVDQELSPSTAKSDNNPHTLFYVIDANGNVVKTIGTAALLQRPIQCPGTDLQLNPALREGYVLSGDVLQLQPFKY